MYVSICQQATNSIIDEHGDGHTVDEEHFTAIDLDEHFNAVMAKYAQDSEMEPEQALVVGTAFAVGGPIALHTDLLSDLAGEFEL
jgi:esterase/lipase